MKNSFGNNIHITLFGESHGPEIGVVIDGLAAGIELDLDEIQRELDLRKPYGKIGTARQEADKLNIVSGFFEGKTTGTPLTVILANSVQNSKDYSKTKDLMRPGHADYTAHVKYNGCQDYRGGGHFSGRLTAPIVAAGAICRQILAAKGVTIGTHIAKIQDQLDEKLPTAIDELKACLDHLNSKSFAVIDDNRGELMQKRIELAAEEGDSVGGVLETAVVGLPAGLGEPFFGSVESVLAQLMFSIPGVKGLEFGKGFGFADLFGSSANDPFYVSNGEVRTTTNNNAGINGGITNGMPVVFRCAVKPTPSIYKTQSTVNIATNENAELQIQGRHDPAIIHRARIVVDSLTAIGLLDLYCEAAGCQAMR